ncbi:MAG: protein kinase [Ktedonobacteraceae bacterium]|nr:protein kinase [Ktedonobacteraceae bacterium]
MDETKSNKNRAIRIGQQLGNYRLIGVLDQGKFSGCYLGERISSKQQIVVDVLQPSLAEDLAKSFFQQTYALSQLVHPHILHIHEAGLTEDHLPFLVFDYVVHVPLQQLYPKGTAQPLTRIFPHIQQIAAALQYAHDRGILHQHIHPGNMLQTSNNEILVCGFAIDAIAQNKQRRSPGQVIDNVAYASPEQVRGKSCPASDQYSLAIAIYEWLSGDLPFHGSPVEIIRRHAHVPPPSLRQKAPMISPAIEDVLFTALAKDPTKRFASISAFIKALEQAQQPGNAPHPTKSITPPPQLATAAATRPAMAPVPSHQWTSSPAMQQQVQQAQVIPVTAPAPMQNPLPVQAPALVQPPAPTSKPIARPKAKQEMTMTRRAFAMGFTALALAGGAGGWLALSRQFSHTTTGTNAPTDTNNTVSTPGAKGNGVLIYRAHPARVTSLAWSPDGKRIASASDDRLVNICNSTTGTTLQTYRGHSAEVYAIAWSPNGKYIASAGADKTVQVWDANTGNMLLTYNGHSGSVTSVSWSSDSRLIASGSEDKTVQVWNATTGNQVILYNGHTAGVLSVTWSPDNTMIASGSWDNTLQAFSTIPTDAFAVGDLVFSYAGHSAEVYAVEWSPNGRSIASASGDKTVQICNGINGKTLRTYKGHSGIVLALAWSPDGKRIASAGADTTVQVWTAVNGQKVFTYHGHTNSVFATTWSPDGKRIASAGSDNTMQVISAP